MLPKQSNGVLKPLVFDVPDVKANCLQKKKTRGKDKEVEEEDKMNDAAAENQPAKKTVGVQNPVEAILNKLKRKRKPSPKMEDNIDPSPFIKVNELVEKEKKLKKDQKGKKEHKVNKEQNLKEEASEVPRIIVPRSMLRVRTSPSPIFGLIDYLTDEQKEAVREIGFGGLLKLTLKENQLDLICFLLNSFDFSRCSLDMCGGELVIREQDVLSVFDLPQGKGVVTEMSLLKGNEKFDKFVQDYRSRWNFEWGSPVLKVIEESLIEREDYGDDFKRDFVVLAVNSLFDTTFSNTKTQPKCIIII
ncbi:hypothetical protein CASFOL_030844 [Castilleja foliolosa]|uniref:Uncharacterized protein n=1 Tax=Castilleja foliolosa TaxID=1961234 RepID=A0ABD3C998_9LAMI